MAKATVKAESGMVITIEGTDQEVAAVIRMISSRSTPHANARPQEPLHGRSQAKRETASDLILDLRGEGFFDKPKSLSEVAATLQERGFLFPVTTLSGVMLGSVKRKQLRRKQTEGRWVYGK